MYEIAQQIKRDTNKENIYRDHDETLNSLRSQSNEYARVTTAKQIEVITKI